MAASSSPRAEVASAWRAVITVPPEALEEWLTTPESFSVGSRAPGQRHSVGQLAGMRTLELLEIPDDEWGESDVAHARRTLGFVRRHRAQWPAGDVSGRRWRHALRNWGHDPLWEDRLALAGADTVELQVDGHRVGHLVVEEAGASVELVALELDPRWRRIGLGTAALHRLQHGADRTLIVHDHGLLPERLRDRLRL